MSCKAIPKEYHLVQDRVGQPCRPNTWYDYVYQAIPNDKYATTTEIYMDVADKYPAFDHKRCQTTLWSLSKRQLVERIRLPQNFNQYAYRRLES